jgi:hypothetical protein
MIVVTLTALPDDRCEVYGVAAMIDVRIGAPYHP